MAESLIKTKKLKASKFAARYTIPTGINNLSMKNISGSDIFLAFDGEKTGDAYQLSRGEQSPTIAVKDNIIHYCTKGDDTADFVLLMWE